MSDQLKISAGAREAGNETARTAQLLGAVTDVAEGAEGNLAQLQVAVGDVTVAHMAAEFDPDELRNSLLACAGVALAWLDEIWPR